LGRILAAPQIEQFAFDPAGNIINPNQGQQQGGSAAISAGGASQATTPSNRIAVYEDLRFAYDVHGNIVERKIGWHTVQQLVYNAEHQLQSLTVTRLHDKPQPKEQKPPASTTQTTRYRYDALGRRIDKSNEFGSTRFGWDGDLLALEIRGSRQSEYLYEPDSFIPLAKIESDARVEKPQAITLKPEQVAALFQKSTDSQRNTAQAQEQHTLEAAENEADESAQTVVQKPKDFAIYYYQCDQIGAPQELTDEEGNIVWAVDYKVWGRTQELTWQATGTDDADPHGLNAYWPGGPRVITSRTSTQSLTLNKIEQPLRFQGQYLDAESGLHYNRFRYYDPQTGRFVHQDPIGLEGGENPFIYAQNPFLWYDHLGLKKLPRLNVKKPTYENPGHHDPAQPDKRRKHGKTSILPCHHEALAKAAVPDSKGKNWYAIDDKGVIHRFQAANGKMHWAGDTSQEGGLAGIDSYAKGRLDEIFKAGKAVSTRCP